MSFNSIQFNSIQCSSLRISTTDVVDWDVQHSLGTAKPRQPHSVRARLREFDRVPIKLNSSEQRRPSGRSCQYTHRSISMSGRDRRGARAGGGRAPSRRPCRQNAGCTGITRNDGSGLHSHLRRFGVRDRPHRPQSRTGRLSVRPKALRQTRQPCGPGKDRRCCRGGRPL
jgi:hypothetical protein